MTNAPSPEFSNDRPLSSKSDDMLNRAPFAEGVSGILRGLPKGTGLVVGIHGPWGDGKTTVLNMLRADLETNEKIVVCEFNPWRLSDEDSMLRGFFGMLADAIEKSLSTKFEDTKAAAAKWTKPFRWITKPAGLVWKPAETADGLLAKIGEIAASGDTVALDELRGRIDKQLTASDKRIIVLVDDIDRLDKHETHTLFRLIKACADFPNVCYVLAFDDVAVAKSLGERYGAGDEASGRAFLEKIIQVPLKLPVAMKEDLRSLCFQQVDMALSAAGMELSRDEFGEFVSGFERGISIQLDTPRAAKRYGNGLMFALPMLKGEANIVDLLLIEAVRAFHPAIYDIIRANHTEFSGLELSYTGLVNPSPIPRCVSLLQPTVDSLLPDEQRAFKSLLKDLFPRLGSAYGGSGHGSEWLSHWAKAKRICSPDYCPRYFTYSVLKNDIRDSELESLYSRASLKSTEEVTKTLKEYFEEGKAKRIIERMREREARTPPDTAISLCLAISTSAKYIPNPPSLYSFVEPISQTGMLISRLIQQLPAGEPRLSLTKKVIEAADPLWFAEVILRWLHMTNDADKADHNTLTKDEVDEASKALVERIKVRANAGETLFNVDVSQEQSLLYEWWRVEGREPVQAHLTSIFESDPKNIALFLEAMAPKSWGENDVLPRVGRFRRNQLKNIDLIFDLDTLVKLIREHLPGNYENPREYPEDDTPIVQWLPEQFVFLYNNWKKDVMPADPVEDDISAGENTISESE